MASKNEQRTWKRHRALGLVCTAVAAAMLFPSIPLHCVSIAFRVGCTSIASGALFGVALGMVTRTLRPLVIYSWLLVAAVTVLPLTSLWPFNDYSNLGVWGPHGNSMVFYLEAASITLWMVAMPFPFATIGFHQPDIDRAVEGVMTPPVAESLEHVDWTLDVSISDFDSEQSETDSSPAAHGEDDRRQMRGKPIAGIPDVEREMNSDGS